MSVVRWSDGTVAVDESVASARPVTGEALRDGYLKDISVLTLGLVRERDGGLWLGPLLLIRFGDAQVEMHEVSWPIEGGLLARMPGGGFALAARAGRLIASLDGYHPRLPRPVYSLTQLQVHRLITRLFLLRVRGRRPAAGMPADPARRITAAAVDVSLCAGVAMLLGRRGRLAPLVGIAVGYHLACWTISGRTLGGVVTRQRVVSIDGSRLSLGQAILRLLALPLATLRLRAVHDEIACTDVITD